MPTISKIRRAVPGDAEAVAACIRAAYRMYLPRIAQPLGSMLQDYAQVIAARVVWLLLVGNKIAGLLVLMARAGHLLLDNIAVHPDYHGQGLGG